MARTNNQKTCLVIVATISSVLFGAVVAAAPSNQRVAITIILVFLGLLLLCWQTTRILTPSKSDLGTLLRLTLSVHIIASIILYWYSSFAFNSVVLGGTANTWYRVSLARIGAPESQSFLAMFRMTDDAYFWIVATLYQVPHIGQLLPIALNIFASCILVAYTYRLALLLLTRQEARWVGIGTAFFPSLILFSYHTSPDMLSVTFSVAALFYLTKWTLHSGSNIGNLSKFAIAVLSLSLLRPHQALIFTLVIFGLGIWFLLRRHDHFTLSRIIYWGLAIAATVFLAYQADIFSFRSTGGISGLQEYFTTRTMRIEDKGSHGFVLSLLKLPPILRWLAGFIPLVLLPFPIWRPFTDATLLDVLPKIYALDVPLFYPLFGFSILGIISVIRGRREEFYPVSLYFFFLASALTWVYAGGEVRFRAQLVPSMLLLAVLGLRYRKKRGWISVFGGGYLLLYIFYFVILD